jgi:gluconolactonase
MNRIRRTPRLLSILTLIGILTACEQPPAPAVPEKTIGRIERLDPAFDALVAQDAHFEVLADGLDWSEGPVWVPDGGFLLFSDVPRDTIYKWQEGAGLTSWLHPSGYTGTEPRGGEPGSNGLVLDAEGRLVLCQHGDRRIARLDAPWEAPQPHFETLASAFAGHRFHSPNDLVYDQAGHLYFTDPPYGLAGGTDGPGREMDFQGVYRLTPAGDVTLITDALTRPNGIGLSPDEKVLYVANSDPERAVWMAYDLAADGSFGDGRVFFDATSQVGEERPGLPDGLAVDPDGNLFASGPGGILVFSPEGTHLGTLNTGEATSNCTFGDDGRTLYVTADAYLLRIRLKAKG